MLLEVGFRPAPLIRFNLNLHTLQSAHVISEVGLDPANSLSLGGYGPGFGNVRVTVLEYTTRDRITLGITPWSRL